MIRMTVLFAGINTSGTNVLADRVLEFERFLQQDRELFTKALGIELSDIGVVEINGVGIRIVESSQEFDES